jgi:cytoskeletal protein RodZ
VTVSPVADNTAVVRSEEPLSALRDDFQRSLSIPPEEHDAQTDPKRVDDSPQIDSPNLEDRSRPVDPNALHVKQDKLDAATVPVTTSPPKEQPPTDLLDKDDTLAQSQSESGDDEDMEIDIKGVYYQGEDGELTPVVW